MKFEYYRDAGNAWRWKLRAVNGETLAVSSESYVDKRDCLRCIELVKKSSRTRVERIQGEKQNRKRKPPRRAKAEEPPSTGI